MRGVLSLFIALLASSAVSALPGDPHEKDKWMTKCETKYYPTKTVGKSPYTYTVTSTVHVPKTETTYVPKTETYTKTKIVEDKYQIKKPVVYTDCKTVSEPYLVTVTSYKVKTVTNVKTSYTREFPKERVTTVPKVYTTTKEAITHVPVTTKKEYTSEYTKTETKCYTKKKDDWGHH
ncbi:hypothetical protein H2201_008716 [Coniosporium apollinis]|uniref:Uncharacterized protein n=1 Tax=Coniosporium apollinis TaxID=61459 RepID=A0ABQ9NFI3_9PEZI|nr:hypothetical protein H2201_008716 [Coniosporium apollinis]